MLRRILIGLGVGMVLIGFLFVKAAEGEELRLAGVEKTLERMTLAQLITRGPGGPKHVIVSDYAMCDDYVVVKRRTLWEGVYLPIIPHSWFRWDRTSE